MRYSCWDSLKTAGSTYRSVHQDLWLQITDTEWAWAHFHDSVPLTCTQPETRALSFLSSPRQKAHCLCFPKYWISHSQRSWFLWVYLYVPSSSYMQKISTNILWFLHIFSLPEIGQMLNCWILFFTSLKSNLEPLLPWLTSSPLDPTYLSLCFLSILPEDCVMLPHIYFASSCMHCSVSHFHF